VRIIPAVGTPAARRLLSNTSTVNVEFTNLDARQTLLTKKLTVDMLNQIREDSQSELPFLIAIVFHTPPPAPPDIALILGVSVPGVLVILLIVALVVRHWRHKRLVPPHPSEAKVQKDVVVSVSNDRTDVSHLKIDNFFTNVNPTCNKKVQK
jgi:hypothetical protein